MFATSLALIATAFTGRDRGTAFGIYGAVIGGAVAVGRSSAAPSPAASGGAGSSSSTCPSAPWPSSSPLPRSRSRRTPAPGASTGSGFVTFSASLFLLVFALVRGNDLGWGSTTIIGLLVGGRRPHGRRSSSTSTTPRTPCSTWGCSRSPPSWASPSPPSRLAASIFAMFLYLTLYIQDDLGYGPLAAGLRFLPMTLVTFVVASFAGRLTVRVQSRSCSASACSSSAVRAPPDGHGPRPTRRGRCCCPASSSAASASASSTRCWPRARCRSSSRSAAGMASGANNTFRQVGIATGIAVLGAVFQSQIVSHTSAALGKSAVRLDGAPARGARAAGRHWPPARCAMRAAAIPVAGARQALLDAYHVRVLGHLQPPVGHRGRRGLRRRLCRLRPGAPDATSSSPAAAAMDLPGRAARDRGGQRPADAVPAAHA